MEHQDIYFHEGMLYAVCCMLYAFLGLGLGGIFSANLKVIPALKELFKYDHDHDP
jgi:hypothetical protein